MSSPQDSETKRAATKKAREGDRLLSAGDHEWNRSFNLSHLDSALPGRVVHRLQMRPQAGRLRFPLTFTCVSSNDNPGLSSRKIFPWPLPLLTYL